METIAVSINDAAKALSIGRTTVYKLINEGRLETMKIGRRQLIKSASLHNLANDRIG